MSEVQQEIGLTDDEVTLIIFTSLDLDWLNNLIVLAGEFTLWFNINFEGDSRDETDFRDNKYEIWEATVSLAKVIVAEYEALPANQQIILTQDWWNVIRFKKFGLEMAQKFRENPALQKKLRELFLA